jgi:hypothetical protein
MAIALALTVPAVPAIAGVSQAARTACEKAPERVREKEAWIANCLADASTGTPPKKDSGY